MYYIERIKNHLINWLDYIKTHLVRFIFISLLLLGACYFLTTLPKEANNGEQQIFISEITISNWSTWLGILGVAGTAIWAFYEFDKSRIASQQEKASDIAKIFSDDLLIKCGILIAVFQNSSLNGIIEAVNDLESSFNHFTTDELREITDEDDFPSLYKERRDNIDFDYIYHRILEKRITTVDDYSKKYPPKNIKNTKNITKHFYTTEEARGLFILDNKNFPFHFMELVDEVLNSLEYVCMSISSHAAGSNFIYQSLHQMFFDTIKTLTIEISVRNDGKYADKFYTNVIHVYTEWQKIYDKSTKNEKNKKAQNKRILNPKIKTVE